MTIQQQLDDICSKLQKINQSYMHYLQSKKDLNLKYDGLRESMAEKYQNLRVQNDNLHRELMNYYDIVSDCTERKLRANSIQVAPDFDKLSDLLAQVDMESSEDMYAYQIVDLVSGNIAYVERIAKEINDKEKEDSRQLNLQKMKEICSLNQRGIELEKKVNSYLTGKQCRKLFELFQKLKDAYAITDSSLEKWHETSYYDRGIMLVGFWSLPLDIPEPFKKAFKKCMRSYYRENDNILEVPCGFSTRRSQEIICEFSDYNEDKTKEGIQAIIINYIRHFKLSHFKLSILDYVYYSAEFLGPLSVFNNAEHSPIDRIPVNEKELNEQVDALINYYKNQVWPLIGTESVYEYNQHSNDSNFIPYRIIIIIQSKHNSSFLEDAQLTYLKNNASKLGISIISLKKCFDGGSKGTNKEQQYLAKAKDYIRIITDKTGKFYIENDIEWRTFRWLLMPVKMLPDIYAANVIASSKPLTIGTNYFDRYILNTPKRSIKVRRSIKVPIAIRKDDRVVECSFENELFAAFMMGASRSGKSTLLHTIIAGLISNYHPDELELWLLDFKMVEFMTYIRHKPPHVKYVLLQNSIDLVYDVINKMIEILNERKYIFSQHGWKKLEDVPLDVYMPAIFVIIDEFSDMSYILMQTKNSGLSSDYTEKLAELLREGAAHGFKFIFASQTYIDGVGGLTDQAKKQIQQRIALKNTPLEIKETLALSSGMISPALTNDINTLPPFESIFKWRDNNRIHIERLRNLYILDDQLVEIIEKLSQSMKPVDVWNAKDDLSFLNKHAVLIDGGTPKAYVNELIRYLEFERNRESSSGKLHDGEYYIYPGIPCSFQLAIPFIISRRATENILLLSDNCEQSISVLLSVMYSFKRQNSAIQIWAYDRDTMFEKYRNNVLNKTTLVTSLKDICAEIRRIKENYENRIFKDQLIVVLGYEYIASELEIIGSDAERIINDIHKKGAMEEINIQDIMQQVKSTTNPCERKKIIDDYNAYVEEYQKQQRIIIENDGIYDARRDLQSLVEKVTMQGTHFLFCFSKPADLSRQGLKPSFFRHKLVFSLSRDDSFSVIGNKMASEIKKEIFLYSDGKISCSYKPHLHENVLLDGWTVSKSGRVFNKNDLIVRSV